MRTQSVPFVRVVDAAEGDVLLVFEEAVEVRVHAVELELGEDEGHVGADEGPVACQAVSARARGLEPRSRKRTSRDVSPDGTRTRLEPSRLVLPFLETLQSPLGSVSLVDRPPHSLFCD